MKKKYKVIKTISSHMGTLYKDEVVTLVEEGLEGGLKVRDATGRLWNVSKIGNLNDFDSQLIQWKSNGLEVLDKYLVISK